MIVSPADGDVENAGLGVTSSQPVVNIFPASYSP